MPKCHHRIRSTFFEYEYEYEYEYASKYIHVEKFTGVMLESKYGDN